MSEETRQSVRIERVIRAGAERIFAAWTDAAELQRWFAPEGFTVASAQVDATPGGSYCVVMRAPDGTQHTAMGTYLRVEAPSLLTFTWRWASSPQDEADTIVTIEFIPLGDATRLVLLHTGFADEAEKTNHENGWTSCMLRLVTLTEET